MRSCASAGTSAAVQVAPSQCRSAGRGPSPAVSPPTAQTSSAPLPQTPKSVAETPVPRSVATPVSGSTRNAAPPVPPVQTPSPGTPATHQRSSPPATSIRVHSAPSPRRSVGPVASAAPQVQTTGFVPGDAQTPRSEASSPSWTTFHAAGRFCCRSTMRAATADARSQEREARDAARAAAGKRPAASAIPASAASRSARSRHVSTRRRPAPGSTGAALRRGGDGVHFFTFPSVSRPAQAPPKSPPCLVRGPRATARRPGRAGDGASHPDGHRSAGRNGGRKK